MKQSINSKIKDKKSTHVEQKQSNQADTKAENTESTGFFSNMWNSLSSTVSSGWDRFTNQAAESTAQAITDESGKFISKVGEKVGEKITGKPANTSKDKKKSGRKPIIAATAQKAANVAASQQGSKDAQGFLSSIFSPIKGFFDGIMSVVSSVITPINSMLGPITNYISHFFNEIKNFFGFGESKDKSSSNDKNEKSTDKNDDKANKGKAVKSVKSIKQKKSERLKSLKIKKKKMSASLEEEEEIATPRKNHHNQSNKLSFTKPKIVLMDSDNDSESDAEFQGKTRKNHDDRIVKLYHEDRTIKLSQHSQHPDKKRVTFKRRADDRPRRDKSGLTVEHMRSLRNKKHKKLKKNSNPVGHTRPTVNSLVDFDFSSADRQKKNRSCAPSTKLKNK